MPNSTRLRRKHQTLNQEYRKITLCKFPNEIIIAILQHLSIPDLLIMFLILNCKLRTLTRKVLVEKLLDTDKCHLRLCFDQENRWRFTLDFKLAKTTDSRLAFTPFEPVSVRMYTSRLLRKPNLYKACLVGPDFAEANDALLVNNLIKSSLSLDIKDVCIHQHQYNSKQHRVFFAYQTHKTPQDVIKQRPGERWVEPLGFECSFDFLAQPKKMIHRVFNTLHNKPTRRQIDSKLFTTSSRLPTSSQQNAVAEVGNWWQQKYQHMSPVEESMRVKMMPIIGGLTTST
ncbi:hypothetical protein [Parasitella parasitica]|uniref:F-box domain-containing protein n=1 Tax=Parasitella parasitica TaxID=35722 RepID=A0A0B7NDD5_9FUNG|nr:hypothetical protein [Parasitella parasitica]